MCKGLIFSLIFLQSSAFLFYKSKAEDFALLESSTYQCLKYRKTDECLIALEKVGALKIFAESQGNYLCQTRMLGLESKLIMAMMKMPKSRSYLENIEDIKKVCSSL